MILDNVLQIKLRKNNANETSKEKIKRSLLKTISWRVIGTLDTILISWLITGAMTLALSIGTIELISKMVLYFFHERLWNQIKWGNNDYDSRRNQ